MVKEVQGTHHIKYYIFDNDVILTGANLSESYFTERQDRWYVIKNCKELADYLEGLTEVLINNGFEVGFNSQM